MAWSSPDSWPTRLFSGDPLAIIIAFVVTISLPVLLHLYFYTTTSRLTIIPTFLILGPSGGGKTSLVSLLQRRSINHDIIESSPTRTSQTPSFVTLTLSSSIPLGSNKYRSKNDSSLQDATTNNTKYRLIDTPGHGKLRLEQALNYINDPSLRGVIFIIDSTTIDTVGSNVSRDTAEYLHDTLRKIQKRKYEKPPLKSDIPILIAANKQDLFTAIPPGSVKDRLQNEIEKFRSSRSRGISTVGKDTDVEDDDILGESDQTQFSFKMMEDDFKISVDILGGAVKGEEAGKGIRRWEEWIGGCL